MIRGSFGIKLTAVSALALTLRLLGTEWGKPFAYHFDEPFVLKPALRMVENGDPNPHFFRYPSLLIYLETLVVAANNSLGAMPLREPQGQGYGPQDLYPETWPALFGGRHMVAALGAIGVFAVGVLAGATGGCTAGLIAALALALFPLHVEHSHYLTTDVPAATLATVALAVMLRSTSWRGVAIAGIAAGLATSTKYTAAVVVLPLLFLLTLATTSTSRRDCLARGGILCALALLAFFAATPFALLDTRTFFSDLGIVRAHYAGGHLGAEGTANWGWYLMRLRQDGLGPLGLVTIGVGGLLVLLDVSGALGVSTTVSGSDGPRRSRPLVALLFLIAAAAWFFWLGSVRVRFERNLLPAVVLACAAAGHGWGKLVDAAWRRNVVMGNAIAVVLVASMLGPARVSGTILKRLRSEDTRTLAVDWIESHVGPGSSIVREEYTPQPDANRFRVRYVWSLAASDASEYEREGVDYLIASQSIYARVLKAHQPQVREMAERYRRIFLFRRVASFAPGPDVSGPVIDILEVPHAASTEVR